MFFCCFVFLKNLLGVHVLPEGSAQDGEAAKEEDCCP
jgi:hypothetical protein